MTPLQDAHTDDLGTRAHVHDLVVRFYREIVFDELLAPVFTEVAEVDWTVHIPKLIDYWCRVLLRQPGYDGQLLAAHQHVHALEALRVEHFDRWYELWVETIDAGWSGPIAETAKLHAARTGNIVARHVLGLEWEPPHSARTIVPARTGLRFAAEAEPDRG